LKLKIREILFLPNGFLSQEIGQNYKVVFHCCHHTHTGGITKFSAKEDFRKILKVSHFSLGFSLNKKV